MSVKLVLSKAMSIRNGYGVKVKVKVLVLDSSRAHFHPKAKSELYIPLPEENVSPGMVGHLLHMMNGMRHVANGRSFTPRASTRPGIRPVFLLLVPLATVQKIRRALSMETTSSLKARRSPCRCSSVSSKRRCR